MIPTTIFPPLSDVCRDCNLSKDLSISGKYECPDGHIPDGKGNCKYHDAGASFFRGISEERNSGHR